MLKVDFLDSFWIHLIKIAMLQTAKFIDLIWDVSLTSAGMFHFRAVCWLICLQTDEFLPRFLSFSAKVLLLLSVRKQRRLSSCFVSPQLFSSLSLFSLR